MNEETILLRQINPSWIQGERVTSQAFKPFPKDESQLSVYDGDLIEPGPAFDHYTNKLGFRSVGVQGVSVSECDGLDLQVRPDPDPFPEHAVIDVTDKSKKDATTCAKVLRDNAQTRGWLHRND